MTVVICSVERSNSVEATPQVRATISQGAELASRSLVDLGASAASHGRAACLRASKMFRANMAHGRNV